MLTIEKLREKIDELNAQRLYGAIEWEEAFVTAENPLNTGVSVGNFTPPSRFRLEEMSTDKAKLYIYDKAAECFVGIMILDR